MARPREWERIARDQHISFQAVLASVAGDMEEVIMLIRNDGPALKVALRAYAGVADVRARSRIHQALIEDNDKSAAEIEERVLAKYRTKGDR